jgi:16S rRNA (cytidine1402-2'-O)-methyltransferase
VQTTIGNLEDITLRAMNILRTADVVASEDTRHTGRLLQLLGIERKGQLLSHHEHNAQRRVPELVSLARVRWALLFKCTCNESLRN